MQEVLELKVVNKNIDCVTSTAVIDVPRNAVRYELHLAFFPDSNHYLLNIINFNNISVYTHSNYANPDFKYPLMEKGVAQVDASNIQQIVNEMLLKEIGAKVRRRR